MDTLYDNVLSLKGGKKQIGACVRVCVCVRGQFNEMGKA